MLCWGLILCFRCDFNLTQFFLLSFSRAKNGNIYLGGANIYLWAEQLGIEISVVYITTKHVLNFLLGRIEEVQF